MVFSRRISRVYSKAKYQGKRRAGQALRPAHHNFSWGKLPLPVAQRYRATSDALGREFDPANGIFLTEKLKKKTKKKKKNAQRVEND